MILNDKIAIVTGAGMGIGRATALALAAQGATVIAADIDVDLAKETSRLIKSNKCESIPMNLDVTSTLSVNQAVAEIVKRFSRIDILVNNAGILGHPSPVVDLAEDEWNSVFNVNAKGVFLCCRAVGKQMILQRHGRIVNIVSLAARSGNGYGFSPYHSSKHAALGLTRCLALELAPFGINVNAVCPGYVEGTSMHSHQFEMLGKLRQISEEEVKASYKEKIPLGRLAKPEEVAELVVFLCSGASYITGQAINICGGLRSD